MDLPLFDPRILGPFFHYLDRSGVVSQAYLDRARIPGQMIESGGWIAKKQAYDFVHDVVHRERFPSAVFAGYRDFRLEDLGPIGDAMKSCMTVKESLEIATRLGSVAFEGNEYFLEMDGDTVWLCYHEPKSVSAGQEFINDMSLAVFCHLIRLTADQSWRPRQLRKQGQETDRHRGVDLFQECEASFHASSTAIGFPTEFLSRLVPWHQSLSEFNESDAWELGADQDGDFVNSLYRLIASRFQYRTPPTLDQAATLVGVSPATLKRRLSTTGIGYRRLLDRVRYEAACELLSSSQVAIHEIANELGYSGTNNFVRSFRRIAGMTPGRYRLHALER